VTIRAGDEHAALRQCRGPAARAVAGGCVRRDVDAARRRSRLLRNHGELAIKVRVPRDAPHVRSVADVWSTADWHEREAFDLLGVTFDQHPDPRRILCPDDWVGHPLRKDYEFPTEYQGIPCAAAGAE